jgi:hypothetical protein
METPAESLPRDQPTSDRLSTFRLGMETLAESLPRDQPTSDRLSTFRLGLERRFNADRRRCDSPPEAAGASPNEARWHTHIARAPRRSLELDRNRLGESWRLV